MKLNDRTDRTLYSVVIALLVLGCIELLGQLRGFFLDIWRIVWAVGAPVVVALIATYVLRPVVDLLHARKVPRTVAILFLYAALAVLGGVVLVNVVPVFGAQLGGLLKQLPAYVTVFDGMLDHLSFAARVLPNGVRLGLERALGAAEAGVVAWLSGALLGIRDIVSGAVSALVIPFLTFYLLKDYSLFTQLAVRLFPASRREAVARILSGVDHSLGQYVRGQLLIMLLVGAATLAGLLVVGMPYALLLSAIVALTNVIPYVGPFLGAAPALLMAFGVSQAMLFKVLLVNLVVQQLEGNVISPWIMGRTMNLHPVVILLAIMFAGETGGVVGLIFAVPLLAVVKVIWEQVHATQTRA